MQSVAKRVGSLLHDPKYSDLKIRCDGRTFYAHRAIVFSMSEVLAQECEDYLKGEGIRAVVNSLFDASTFERMLQFMYEGDYTVDPVTNQNDNEIHVNGKASIDGGKENMLPPHLRNVSEKAPSVQQSEAPMKAPPMHPRTAHALVYGIATHYKLPELKAVALKRFKKAKEPPTITDFPGLTKTVYHATASPQDPLRKEFLALLLTDRSAWLATDHFASFLSTDTESHEFATDIITTLAQHLLQKSNEDRSSLEAQATANKMLLSDLDQANEALAKSSSRVRALESELAAAMAENSKLETENTTLHVQNTKLEVENAKLETAAKSQTTTACLLQSDLDQVNEELARSKSGSRRLETENFKLQKDLKDAKDYGEKCWKQVKADQTKVREMEEKLKKETARADRNGAQCTAKLTACNQKDQTIKAKDATIAFEKARADKGLSIVRSIVAMVNRQCECRHCGESLSYTLQPDDRIGAVINTATQPHNHMLRCFMCKTKEYGNLIYQG